ncbi:hypothetical protein L5515_003626 [Caenorhabditis briggsae]|uniref:NTF2-like domain-containing protein n=1 Tax=Caenorhabditis briggsae TaxID=6238 RepID=A0AAE9EJU5_CAEBR|nr:hypothetical protein L5515_003626 [Caenorhabditis briggsae]
MRTLVMLTTLIISCLSTELEIRVNDGSEVRAQSVLDELSNAVIAKNRAAIADCLYKDFFWDGKGRRLNKEEFIDYLLRMSKRAIPKGTVTSAYVSSPGYISTHTDFNMFGKYQEVLFVPEEWQKGRDTIRYIRNDNSITFGTLDKAGKIAVDFLLSLIKAINFKDKEAVLSLLTDDFSISACRGTYDRDFAATMYSNFHDQRMLRILVKKSEYVNGEDIKTEVRIIEPHHLATHPRNPYTIDIHLKSVGGVYKTYLAEYHAECNWPGI